MNLLQHTVAQIAPLDQEAVKAMQKRLERLTKGTGALGRLEAMLLQYAGIIGGTEWKAPANCMVVASADHGVARREVSAYPIETTAQMTVNYVVSRGASANALANFSRSDMAVVDCGVASDLSAVPGLWHRKIAYGTRDFTVGPAMTREEAVRALDIGIEVVREE